MKTLAFKFVVGVNPGYNHKNEIKDAIPLIVEKWDQIQQQNFSYVAAGITQGKMVYPTQFGCPEGGEIVGILEGTCNPNYVSVIDWRVAVESSCDLLRQALGQTTGHLQFTEVDFVRLA